MKLTKLSLFAALMFAFVLALTPAVRADKPGDSIVDIAIGNEDFSTLVAAVSKAGLVETLDGNRMFTVFAPTNDAFDAAAKAVLEDPTATGMDLVNALSPEALAPILLYHVAPGERFSGDVLSADRIRTVSKGFLFVDGTTLVGNNSSANLIAPDLIDIDASNGVIHAIDFVLLP